MCRQAIRIIRLLFVSTIFLFFLSILMYKTTQSFILARCGFSDPPAESSNPADYLRMIEELGRSRSGGRDAISLAFQLWIDRGFHAGKHGLPSLSFLLL